MKIINSINKSLLVLALFSSSFACKKSILDEKPLSFLSPDVTLVNPMGFNSAITGVHASARDLYGNNSFRTYWTLFFGTDIGSIGVKDTYLRDYATQLTSTNEGVDWFWEWGYIQMMPKVNQIIEYADKPTAVWTDEKQKNAVIAEARFFRAYTYNLLTNLYGDVPLVDKVAKDVIVDFKRSPRKEVLEFAKADLEFATKWLPLSEPQPGRIVKNAADHLLTEINISLGQFDQAIAAATAVITSGRNQLMTTRFGSQRTLPGDVYSDMFKEGNQNRSGGNLENIWVGQFEFQTPGGAPAGSGGKNWMRAWAPRYYDVKDPDNQSGMVLIDSLGRGVAWMRPNNYVVYDIWKDDPNDMRNSAYNIRRKWYYNNPSSKYFRQEVKYHANLDTLYHLYPSFLKIEGPSRSGLNTGVTFSDWPVMRLAETYLLRAEAYVMKGEKQKAADDINVIRNRANAKPITADLATLDYILDERLRELLVEEPRRLTLNRTKKLFERVKKYNGFATTVASVEEKNSLFPIPQKFIDANIGFKVSQNPGY